MDLQRIESYIANDNLNAIEDAWLAAVEAADEPAAMQQVLEKLVAAGKSAAADTLATTLLNELVEHSPADRALQIVRVVLPAVKGTNEMRTALAGLYRKVHGAADNFPAFLRLSGLELNQSLRRALRTLDLCLSAAPGQYLTNRFDHTAAKLDRFDPILEQFELVSASGERLHLEPKLLADEYEPADAADFRVMAAFDREKLGALCQDDPAAILMAVCSWRGGKLTADQFKETLCPRHIPADNWSKWWTRARTAAKRCPQLSIEGRAPVTVSYHPGGRTLEDELQPAVDAAKVPLELLGVLRQYARELVVRRQEASSAFTGPILAKLSSQAEAFLVRRPADSLIAALALAEAQALGLPGLPENPLTPAMVVANMPRLTERIASLSDTALQRQAIEALGSRPDAADRLAELLRVLPSDRLDDITSRLRKAGHGAAVEAAVADAMADPEHNLQIGIWLWRGPAERPAGAPDAMELLSRLLQAMQDLANDHEMPREARRVAFEQVRWALTGDDCKAFRAVVQQIPEPVAATLKRRVERNPGLTDVNREKMLAVLREEYYTLFLKSKVEPWADETVLWATEDAIKRRREELKKLQEFDIPANSRAIGVAAAKGDLSENSEWQFAVEEQRRLNSRVAQVQGELAMARALTVHDVPETTVGIGSRVTLTGPEGQVELTILGPWESDAPNRVYSYQTPVALALLGHAVGDEVTVSIDGQPRTCTIAAARPWM